MRVVGMVAAAQHMGEPDAQNCHRLSQGRTPSQALAHWPSIV